MYIWITNKCIKFHDDIPRDVEKTADNITTLLFGRTRYICCRTQVRGNFCHQVPTQWHDHSSVAMLLCSCHVHRRSVHCVCNCVMLCGQYDVNVGEHSNLQQGRGSSHIFCRLFGSFNYLCVCRINHKVMNTSVQVLGFIAYGPWASQIWVP